MDYFEFGKLVYQATKHIFQIQIEKVELEIKDTSNGDLVTKTDLYLEQVLKNLIDQHFPGFGFLSEESYHTCESSKYIWVVDPLDGTNNFALGIPNCGCSLVLYQDGVPIVGIICNPFRSVYYVGIKGRGVRRNNIPFQYVQKNTNGRICLVKGTEDPDFQFPVHFYLQNIKGVHRILEHWAPVIDFGLLIDGFVHTISFHHVNSYDATAGILIAQELGLDWVKFNSNITNDLLGLPLNHGIVTIDKNSFIAEQVMKMFKILYLGSEPNLLL